MKRLFYYVGGHLRSYDSFRQGIAYLPNTKTHIATNTFLLAVIMPLEASCTWTVAALQKS